MSRKGSQQGKKFQQVEGGLRQLGSETNAELDELEDAINKVESLHHDHMKEMKEDKEFINDLKALFQDIALIRRIEEHMLQEVEEREAGNITGEEFARLFNRDEHKLEKVTKSIHDELRDVAMDISEEERLTGRDERFENAVDVLVKELNQQQKQLDKAHKNIKGIVMS